MDCRRMSTPHGLDVARMGLLPKHLGETEGGRWRCLSAQVCLIWIQQFDANALDNEISMQGWPYIYLTPQQELRGSPLYRAGTLLGPAPSGPFAAGLKF